MRRIDLESALRPTVGRLWRRIFRMMILASPLPDPQTISKIDATIVNVFNTIRPLQIYVRVVPNGDKVDLGGR